MEVIGQHELASTGAPESPAVSRVDSSAKRAARGRSRQPSLGERQARPRRISSIQDKTLLDDVPVLSGLLHRALLENPNFVCGTAEEHRRIMDTLKQLQRNSKLRNNAPGAAPPQVPQATGPARAEREVRLLPIDSANSAV